VNPTTQDAKLVPVQFVSITLLNRNSLEGINLKNTLFSWLKPVRWMETSKLDTQII
jgi:hypothetical protein